MSRRQGAIAAHDWPLVGVLTLSCVVYMGGLIFGIVNIIRFRRHRTFSMALFYVTATLCLFLAALYFFYLLVGNDQAIILFLFTFPQYLLCSVAASQLLTYALLSIRLNLYIFERQVRNQEQQQIMEALVIRKELVLSICFTIFIVGFPLAFLIQYFCNVHRQDTFAL